jgi:diaminopimelate epimerase
VIHVVAGVPHTVVNFSELSFPPPAEWVERTQEIHSEWKRRNCDRNLTMAWKTGPTTAGAMTFERGIVGATLACGSGALAVSHTFFGQGACTVVMPGGSLKIDMNPQAVTLAGPVRFVASLDQTRWGI